MESDECLLVIYSRSLGSQKQKAVSPLFLIFTHGMWRRLAVDDLKTQSGTRCKLVLSGIPIIKRFKN